MLKEIFLLAASITPYIQEPQRTIVNANTYEVVNATSSRIMLYQAYSDEEVEFSGKSRSFYPFKVQTADDFELYIYKTDYPTAPTDFYYIYKASDFEEPVSLTFQSVNQEVWRATIDAYEPSTGVQIGRKESLSGVHAYINEERLGINGNLNETLPYDTLTNLIPSGVTFKYVVASGVYDQTFSSLYAYKVKASQGSVNSVALYVDANRTSIIAFNGYDPNLNPFLLYLNQFTNEIVFQSGYKNVVYGEMEGTLPYFFSSNKTGFMRYDDESINSAWDTLTKAFELVAMVFTAIGVPFSWMIMPGISIGILLVVPLLIAMFVWLIKFLKKG